MSFCPFQSNAEKKVQCSADCMLYIVEKMPHSDPWHKSYETTKSYCALAYAANKWIDDEYTSIETNS